jgi:hypothetical protein
MSVVISNLKSNLSNALKKSKLIGIVIPGDRYKETIKELTEYIHSDRNTFWIYVTITKPYESLIKNYQTLLNAPNVEFIDCISQAAGIVKRNGRCSFIDSPTMLENIIMELHRIAQKVPSSLEKNILLDSLTALTIYNDEDLVTEFFYQITNRIVTANVHLVTLFIEREGPKGFVEKILHMNDEIIRISSDELDFDLEKKKIFGDEIYEKKDALKEDSIKW